jgi:predicted alpha/beta hydrolase family esterase
MVLLLLIRPFLILVAALLLAYLLAALLMYLGQNRLLYHPERYSLAEAQRRAQGLGLRPWPPGTPLACAFTPLSPPDPARGTFLVFHGNAGTALDRVDYVSDLQPLGFRVVLAEYPAYGACGGMLGESSFVARGRELVKALQAAYPEPIYLLGESLGAGVACAVAAQRDLPIAGLMLITPWDRLSDLAQDLYPMFPTRHLVRDRYDSIANLAAFTAPIAVVMAARDEIIPNRRTQTLVGALGSRARLWTLHGVGHNNWPGAVDPVWWRDVTDYLAGPADDRLPDRPEEQP